MCFISGATHIPWSATSFVEYDLHDEFATIESFTILVSVKPLNHDFLSPLVAFVMPDNTFGCGLFHQPDGLIFQIVNTGDANVSIFKIQCFNDERL